MLIKQIELINFRNYKNINFVPNEKLNIITGPNGIGKTNLVEGIYYTNLAKGFRNKKDEELIKEGENEFIISCSIENGVQNHKLNFYFNSKKNGKKIYLDGKAIKKLSELNKITNILLFTPSMGELFKNSPQERRDYFDICLSKISDKYFENLKNYKKLVKSRNLALKSENVDRNLIKSIDKQLVPISKTIVSLRSVYVQRLNSIISSISEQISNKSKRLEIIYSPILPINQEFENKLFNLYQEKLEKDIVLQNTSVGIHKENYFMEIEGKDISVFGSQAENRLSVVALILSGYFVSKDETNRPVVILDDVFSELDAENREKLIEFTKKLSQVFITATETEQIEFEKKITEAKQWKKM